jgi:hypothetical protein
MRRLVKGALLVAALSSCSPYGGGAFTCAMDTQCGAGGRCMAGLCAFADEHCASGFRYGELAGGQSNQCTAGATPDGGIDDAPPLDDGPAIDAPPGHVCYGTGPGMVCFAQPPTGTQTIATAIDTDGAMCSTAVDGTPPGCVIAADSIQITGTVAVTGSKPLVLVAVTTLDVQGALDASSHRTPAAQVGAAADFAGCDAGTAPGTHGGGAGGSFGGAGGNGGNDNNGMHAGTAGAAMTTLTALRGGCPGQPGNAGNGTGGTAGHGGGALYLIAGTAITIEGSVNASGQTGTGGATGGAGGGGGGAGGLVALDAPVVTNTGEIFANGGGGAEGAGQNSTGNTATDPTAATAPGGAGATNAGGNGGAGAAGATAAAPGDQAGTSAGAVSGGGGGGGGGAGLIELYQATSLGGTVSPPSS